jgi:hypothetical protein
MHIYKTPFIIDTSFFSYKFNPVFVLKQNPSLGGITLVNLNQTTNTLNITRLILNSYGIDIN